MASLQEQVESGTMTLIWRATLISSGKGQTCPQCEELHGEGGRTMDEWMAYGLPGTGHTYCQGSCNCSLLPEDLLSIDADVLEPFEIKSALDAFPLVTDPIEAARIAANIRIWAEFTEGGRVRYEGPIRPLRGSVGRLRPGGSPERGVVVDFDIESIPTTHAFPEFAEVHVYDLTDLIPVGG